MADVTHRIPLGEKRAAIEVTVSQFGNVELVFVGPGGARSCTKVMRPSLARSLGKLLTQAAIAAVVTGGAIADR